MFHYALQNWLQTKVKSCRTLSVLAFPNTRPSLKEKRLKLKDSFCYRQQRIHTKKKQLYAQNTLRRNFENEDYTTL